jgi:hypothetical protein
MFQDSPTRGLFFIVIIYYYVIIMVNVNKFMED